MAKATIRGNSSQSRMAAPALHSIILSNDAAENTTIRLQHYFRTKKKLHGTGAVAEPVLSKNVVTNLKAMLKGGSEKSSTVSSVVMCLEEFSTNYQVRERWNECSDEIAQLVYDCLVHFKELKRNDGKQKTTNFEDLSESFMKLCHVIYYLAEKSKDLSTKLLKRCSKDLMIILICKHTKEDEIRAVLLQALSSLCKYAKTAEIHQTFSGLSVYLGCLAKMVLDLPVETQIDAYTVLHSSLVTKDDAIKMATIWFSKWPMIRDVFTESFSLNFSKGCGTFLNTLHAVKSLADKSFSTCSLASFTRNIQMDTTANSSASHLVDTDLIVSSKGTAKTARNEIMVPQNNCIPNIASNVPNAAPAMTVDKSQKDTMSVFKTPFHPDYRKSASLHKIKMESIQTVVSKPAEQLSCEGGLRFSETPSVGSEMPLAKGDRSSKRISSKKLETQITKGEIVVSNNPSNETKMPNAGPVVSAGETPRNSKSKQYQTPYYPDHRKSLSLRKRENKSTASENLAEQSAKNVLNYLEGPNSVKPNIGNLGSTVETEKPISLKPKRESNKIGRISKASEEPSLSNLSSEDQSSKVDRWLSLQVPDDWFDNVTDDEKGFGDNNHENSDKRDTYSQKRTLSKQVKDDSPLVSFSSNIGVNNLENKSMKKTRLGKRPVHLYSTANDFGEGLPSAKKKKTNSTTDSSVSHPKNMWEKRLKEFETRRAEEKRSTTDSSVSHPKNMWKKRLEELETRREEEKRNSNDIYCFNVSVPSAPLRTKGVPAKNCVLNKKSPIFNQKSERAKSSKSKQSLEENDKLIDQPHPFNVISKSSSFSIKNPQFLQTSKLSCLIEEEKEMGSHTSDLISTKNVKFVTEAKFSKEKKKEVKSYPHEFFPNKSIRTAQPTTSSFPREEKTEVQSRTTGLKSTNPNRSEKKQYFTPAPLKSPDSYKDKSTEKYFSPVLDDSMEMKKTGMEKQEKAALGDSGFEVTSGSDGGSRSNYKKQSSKSEYLKTFLRANLQKALEANTDIVSKNETITSEMSEIQNLAEKIAKSAGRCMVTNRENCQLLRKQGNALEGCSKYMSSYENHPSQSQESTVSYMKFQAFKRNLKERSRQRTIEALKKALEASYSSSSSDDELQ